MPLRPSPSRRSDPPTVLIVEDNAAMRAFIRSLAEPVSAAVHECADAETALEIYDRIRPDWVLMDITMGGMDGIAATRALRETNPDARVLIITEHGDASYRRAASAAGVWGYLLKDDLLELPEWLTSDGTAEAGS